MRSRRPPSLDLARSSSELGPDLSLAFRPIYKLAFGVAVGAATGLLVFLLTVAGLLLDQGRQANLALLSQFFAGYSVSWSGALVGLLWGFVVGAVFGWFAAFVRNFLLAVWLLWARARADLQATRDFLDHI